MLLSPKHRFLFIANLKTASTSVEKILGPHAEIALTQSAFGKHMSLSEVIGRFGFVFDEAPLSSFYSFAIVREPIDRLHSLYMSHQGDRFVGTGLSTKSLSFEAFLDQWIPRHPTQSVSQHNLIVDQQSGNRVEQLVRFERINQDLPSILRRLIPNRGPVLRLPRLNKSGAARTSISEAARQQVFTLYKDDFELYESV